MTPESTCTGLQFAAYCLTVPPGTPIDSIKPLKSIEWVRLSTHLAGIGQSPEDLLAASSADRSSSLEGSGLEPDRIASLLDRSGQVAIELQRWADHGIWIVTRADDEYPSRLIHHLGDTSPPVLFGAGNPTLAAQDGIAIVGSRNVDETGTDFAERSSRSFARAGLTVISGGARGVDQTAMSAALNAGGTSIGIMSDGLARRLREAEVRTWLEENTLLLTTPYRPDAGFHVGTAMGRNRLIYCLSLAAIVIATEVDGNGKGKGGTWAGAIENLKAGWVPLYVRDEEGSPAANAQLLRQTDPSGRRATPLTEIPTEGVLPDPLPPMDHPSVGRQLTLA